MKDNDYFAKLFSKNLVRIMEQRQKTQTDIINALGFNKSAVSTWVNGTRMPRMDKVDALARYFNIPRSELISEPSKVDRNVAESPPNYTYQSKELEALIAIFNKINIQGQQKILVYANDLLQSGLYKKSSHIPAAEIA